MTTLTPVFGSVESTYYIALCGRTDLSLFLLSFPERDVLDRVDLGESCLVGLFARRLGNRRVTDCLSWNSLPSGPPIALVPIRVGDGSPSNGEYPSYSPFNPPPPASLTLDRI